MTEAVTRLAADIPASGQPFPLTGDACRRLLGLQLAARKERDVAASTAAWVAQLQAEGPAWKLVSSRVAPALTQWLATVHALVSVLNAHPPADPRPRYREWLSQAQMLVSAWPPSDLAAWETLLTASPSRDNPLLRAIVARVLGDALGAVSVPKTISAPLLPLLRADLKFAEEVALPPGAASRAEAAEYIFAGDDEGRWSELQTVALELRESLARSNQLQERLRMGSSSGPAASSTGAVARDLAAAVGELEKLLALGSGGWPVVRSELLRQQLRLCDLLTKAAARAPDPSTLFDNRLPRWIELLTPAGSAPPADPLRAIVPPPVADALPGEPSPAELAQPDAKTFSARHGLRQLIEWLAADSDERARRFSVRLVPLAGLQPLAADEDWSALAPDESRKVLACLIYLDELAQYEQGGVAWIATARSELRTLLDQIEQFVVLDAQLLGRSLFEVSKLVVAVGYIPTGRVQPGNVGKIQQPGYALRSAAGIGEVICPAKILVARSRE